MNTKELTQLKKLFFEMQVGEEKVEDKKIYMDKTSVCGVVPLTTAAKQQLRQTFLVNETNYPIIEYESTARFSVEYLRALLKLLEASGEESCTFHMSTDSPLKVVTQEWEFFLAPRMWND